MAVLYDTSTPKPGVPRPTPMGWAGGKPMLEMSQSKAPDMDEEGLLVVMGAGSG